jgi:hypothetical protein
MIFRKNSPSKKQTEWESWPVCVVKEFYWRWRRSRALVMYSELGTNHCLIKTLVCSEYRVGKHEQENKIDVKQVSRFKFGVGVMVVGSAWKYCLNGAMAAVKISAKRMIVST